MAFLLRLLMVLSMLAVLAGVMIKVNHWNAGYPIFINTGITGIAVYLVGNFILTERNKAKAGK